MKGPLLQPHELANTCHVAKHEPYDKSLTGKEVRGKKATKKIAQRVQRLKWTRDSDEAQMGSEKVENFGARLEGLKGQNEEVGRSSSRERMPWEKDEKVVFLSVKREKHVTVADLTLDKVLLQGLRGEAARMRTWVKVKKAGVTQAVVDEIKRTWRTNELAMVKFDIPLCRNMDRAREIVETQTGGLVVWCKKDALVVYRGCNHRLASKGSPKTYTGSIHSQRTNPYEMMNGVNSAAEDDLYWAKSNHSTSEIPSWNADHKNSLSTDRSLYERECDRLLDGLGVRTSLH